MESEKPLLLEIGLGKYAAISPAVLVSASEGMVWRAGVCTAGADNGFAVDAIVRVRVHVSPGLCTELEEKWGRGGGSSPGTNTTVDMFAMIMDELPALRDRAVSRLQLAPLGASASEHLELTHSPSCACDEACDGVTIHGGGRNRG